MVLYDITNSVVFKVDLKKNAIFFEKRLVFLIMITIITYGGGIMRASRQRDVVLEDLRSVTSHPTADEVYEMSRRRIPTISLGTVYRNLEALAEKGVIRRLSLAGAKRRYDGDISRHYHSRCPICERIFDLPAEESATVAASLEDVRRLDGVEGIAIELRRVCADCSVS